MEPNNGSSGPLNLDPIPPASRSKITGIFLCKVVPEWVHPPSILLPLLNHPAPTRSANMEVQEVKFIVTHLLYMLPAFLHCLTSVLMVSIETYCMDQPWKEKRFHINLTRPNQRTMTQTVSPVTTYSHTASNNPSMDANGQPHQTSAPLCMFTTTVAGKGGEYNPYVPRSHSRCLFFFLFLKVIWPHGWVFSSVLWFPCP